MPLLEGIVIVFLAFTLPVLALIIWLAWVMIDLFKLLHLKEYESLLLIFFIWSILVSIYSYITYQLINLL
jgi:hypothetical protein